MNSKKIYNNFQQKLLSLEIGLGTILILLSLLSSVTYAQSNTNKKVSLAKIDSVNGVARYAPRGTEGISGANNASLELAKKGQELRIPMNQLLIPKGQTNNIARLIFLSQQTNTILPNTLFVARSSTNFATIFHYYCITEGNVGIAWKSQDKKKSDCDAFTIGGTKESTNKQLSQKVKRDVVTYCSAAAESGTWGAVISDNSWDILSPNDPCSEAMRRCQLNSNNLPCTINNLGEIYAKEIREKLTTVLVCNKDESLLNNPPRKQENSLGELDSWIQQQARTDSPLSSSDCSLHVMNEDDLLAIPASNQITVISAGDDILPPPNTESVIVVLAGKITLVSPDPNVPTETIIAGQACYPSPNTSNQNLVAFPYSTQQSTGQTSQLPSGQSSICASFSSNRINQNLPLDIRQTIYKSPAVQNFLQGWETPEVQQDVTQNYKPEIEREFLNIAGSTPIQ